MQTYNYGTAVNKLINSYLEMLELIVKARIATDRIDEWQKDLELVINPEQIYGGIILKQSEATYLCEECGEVRIDDDRVIFGMKCGHCAYGY